MSKVPEGAVAGAIVSSHLSCGAEPGPFRDPEGPWLYAGDPEGPLEKTSRVSAGLMAATSCAVGGGGGAIGGGGKGGGGGGGGRGGGGGGTCF